MQCNDRETCIVTVINTNMKQPIRVVPFIIFALVILTIPSCKKEQHYMNNAEISVDDRLVACFTSDPCNCPGGFFVFIDGVSNVNGRTYKAPKLPLNFTVKQSSMAVKIDWVYDTAKCNNYINITRIESR
jgi:hypothetical protein